MELFDLLDSLEAKITELSRVKQEFSVQAQTVSQLKEENSALQNALEQERQTRREIESRISAMLVNLDRHLGEKTVAE